MTLSDMLLLCTGVASFPEALLLLYLGLYFVCPLFPSHGHVFERKGVSGASYGCER